MKIGRHEVGPGHPCLIVAEVGLAHEGSLGMAHAFIGAIARAGADAVKFQCHDGQPNQPWRGRSPWPRQDETRVDYWRRTAFTFDQWRDLHSHVTGSWMEFLCSPFSVEAVEMLDPLVPAWKIASGQVTNTPMLEAAGATGKPGIISMGMAEGLEIYNAVQWWKDYALLYSTPLYPTPPTAVGLNRFVETCQRDLRDWKWIPYGLSDHSGTIYPGIAAAALGANILEVHVTMSRDAYGPDVAASLTFPELRQLVEGVRFVERAMQPMSEDARRQVEEMRKVYMAHA